ncbi:uncharacterized protein EV420DRAFT_493228 [Desarmillaria tabescens]|uniref:Uncharacterized protein n=1 Tax=Armillaria tabescens TaxID=1929756 RepID=A0AA39N4R9_ARMTA|nr:uncharacterized protein EV420DRAFT_493228 [Desarmillaria tabescens]KAK0457428.1 hypothetical protein EV420DRAFT_493228 [Desarmillaria tabescens]
MEPTGETQLASIDAYLVGRVNLAVTAEALTQWARDPKHFGDDAEGRLWDLWSAINDRAERTKSSDDILHSKLVELVDAIKHQESPTNDAGEKSKCWGLTLWEDLPIFGANMRECWNFFDAKEDAERASKRERWVNLNAFVARLTAARVSDFELYAIWQLRDALEEPTEESENGGEMIDKSLDAKIPAAVQWILYCGELIYTSEREFETGPSVGDPAKGGELWKGDKRGFCQERWHFWKKRFAELQHYEGLLPETRLLASKAVQVMEGIEKK